MIHLKSANIEQIPNQERNVLAFSEAEDLRWAGMIFLPPNASLQLDFDIRTDLFVLKGSLIEIGIEHMAGAFLSRNNIAQVHAGQQGATVFKYCDRLSSMCGNETVAQSDRQWIHGGTDGMEVAPLSKTHHQLMLVSWLPGTRIGFHTHQWGEEILVLKGELCDQTGRHPAGTWQRFYPESGHAPYAEVSTTILLRNGHFCT